MADQNLLPALYGAEEIPVDPGPHGGGVPGLPIVGMGRKGFGRLDAAHHLVVDARLHGLGQHAGLEAVPHDEIGLRQEDRIDAGDRIAAKRQALFVQTVERLDGGAIVTGCGNASAISKSHDFPPSRPGTLRLGTLPTSYRIQTAICGQTSTAKKILDGRGRPQDRPGAPAQGADRHSWARRNRAVTAPRPPRFRRASWSLRCAGHQFPCDGTPRSRFPNPWPGRLW